jgi:phosphate uptake regulator
VHPSPRIAAADGSDLRLITMAMKISNDLERVGDHAVNIAQAVKHIVEHPPIANFPEIEEMARQASEMLSDALDHFVRSDAQTARGRSARATTASMRCTSRCSGSSSPT